MVLLLPLATSCTTGVRPVESAAYRPENHPGPAMESAAAYTLMGGDVLDIIYQVRPRKIDHYRLNIQDVIEIRFPAMPEHNHQQVVRADGMITLPYIQDVYVLGLTPREATQKVRAALQDVLRMPEIYILIKEFGAGTKELKKVITTASRGQSKLLTVRPDGVVTFPLIGDMRVADQTIPDVSNRVNTAYKKLYPELQVDVILFQTAGTYVYVFGEVAHPGAYKIIKPITYVNALVLAGGTTPKARLSDVVVSHRTGNKMICHIVDLKSGLEGRTSAYTPVLPETVIYVPPRPLSTAAQVAKELSELTFFTGWGLSFSWELESDGQ